MSSKLEVCVAYATFPDMNTAKAICEKLVREGTIACANIYPAHTSIYSWQGNLETQSEVAAWLKTSINKKKELKERFQAEHPFEVPCLVFVDVTDGLPDFLRWIVEQTA